MLVSSASRLPVHGILSQETHGISVYSSAFVSATIREEGVRELSIHISPFFGHFRKALALTTADLYGISLEWP